MKLNDQQEKAANHLEGPCLVTACPGSGKTRVITERTLRLIERGIDPSTILCITFTNKASNEMKERIEKQVGAKANSIFVATFHRLCSFILRDFGSVLGYTRYLSILDENEQYDIIAQIVRKRELELSKPQIKKIIWHLNDSRENLETSHELADRLDAEEERQGNNGSPVYFPIAQEYLNKIRSCNQIDFTGLLYETVRLFNEHENILKLLQNRWEWFQVDEVQDTNLAQFSIVEMLGAKTKNVFVVGDIDQSIYSWRGARVENIRDFRKKFANTTVISLGKNYRSTPQIVKVADKLICHNDDRIAAPFETDNPDGPPVALKAYVDDREESRYVAYAISDLVNRGFSYKDMAVFYRMNSMSRSIEMALIQARIPHTIIGSFSFFDRKEIKDTLAMLQFMTNPHNGIAFQRFANKPKRGMGDVAVGKIEKFAHDNKVTILDAFHQMELKGDANSALHILRESFDYDWQNKPIGEILTHLVEKLKYDDYLKEDDESYLDRKENVQELINDATRFSAEHGNDLAAYLDQVALMSSADKSADGDSVSLMSLHASKGLEFPVVFVLGCEQDILPHKRAVQERNDGLSEERRLCYVGMTRAKRVLTLSHCLKRQDSGYARAGELAFRKSKPSQFLYEAGLLKVSEIKPNVIF